MRYVGIAGGSADTCCRRLSSNSPFKDVCTHGLVDQRGEVLLIEDRRPNGHCGFLLLGAWDGEACAAFIGDGLARASFGVFPLAEFVVVGAEVEEGCFGIVGALDCSEMNNVKKQLNTLPTSSSSRWRFVRLAMTSGARPGG